MRPEYHAACTPCGQHTMWPAHHAACTPCGLHTMRPARGHLRETLSSGRVPKYFGMQISATSVRPLPMPAQWSAQRMHAPCTSCSPRTPPDTHPLRFPRAQRNPWPPLCCGMARFQTHSSALCCPTRFGASKRFPPELRRPPIWRSLQPTPLVAGHMPSTTCISYPTCALGSQHALPTPPALPAVSIP